MRRLQMGSAPARVEGQRALQCDRMHDVSALDPDVL